MSGLSTWYLVVNKYSYLVVVLPLSSPCGLLVLADLSYHTFQKYAIRVFSLDRQRIAVYRIYLHGITCLCFLFIYLSIYLSTDAFDLDCF